MYCDRLKKLFHAVDRDDSGVITLREFEAKANAACSQLPSRQDLLHEDDIAWGPRWD